jgi:thioredoxin-related protein
VKTLRFVLAILFVLASGSSAFAAAKAGWLTDYKQAQQEAKAGNKLLLLDFTGSDWCGWCIKMDREVFSNPKFKDYASKNLVLLELDFPRRKEQSEPEKKQNQQLAGQYGIEAFPTLIVLNGEGKKLWENPGFFPDGVDAFIAELEKLRKG